MHVHLTKECFGVIKNYKRSSLCFPTCLIMVLMVNDDDNDGFYFISCRLMAFLFHISYSVTSSAASCSSFYVTSHACVGVDRVSVECV